MMRWPSEPPPPSRRRLRQDPVTDEERALRLVIDHASVLGVLCDRDPSDFRPLPSRADTRFQALEKVFDTEGPLPPSLLGELAKVLAPRLERVVRHLRSLLGRERRLLPIRDMREMDPTCLRRNARRPGLTLLEKAGAKLELHGVQRRPRFDTAENRMLLTVSRRIVEDGGALLRGIDAPDNPDVAALRRLVQAAHAVLDHPFLAGIGPGFPQARPSNAMLFDADYRATWRASRLLRTEEARFCEAWTRPRDLWRDLVTLAAWRVFDARSSLEPLPGWVRVQEGRLETGGPRAWVSLGALPVRLEVFAEEDGVRVVEQVRGKSPREWRFSSELPEAPGRRTAALAVQALGDVRGQRGRRRDPPPVSDIVGIDALSALLRVTGGKEQIPCAVASLPVPDEPDILVGGRAATFLGGVAGPRDIFEDRAESGGRWLSSFAGRLDTALVVPDSLDEVARVDLRRGFGPCWLVWSTVAAALAAAERDPVAWPAEPPEGEERVLVVVSTDAGLDVTVLEWTSESRHEGLERLWIRPLPTDTPLPGRSPPRSDPRFGAWLRDPGAPRGWIVHPDRFEAVELPLRQRIPVHDVVQRTQAWSPGPRRGIAVGLDLSEREALARVLPLDWTFLDGDALASGARVFLDRHHKGLPTWKDLLPTLDLEVRRDRLRSRVNLIPPRTFKAPGEEVAFFPKETFSLPLRRRVELPLHAERSPQPYVLALDGPVEPLEVRVEVRYLHGRQGIEGALIPTSHATVARLPFRLARPERTVSDVPPDRPRAVPPSDTEVADMRQAFDLVRRAFKAIQSRSVQDPKALEDALLKLTDILVTVRGSDAAHLPPKVRKWFETDVAPILDQVVRMPGSWTDRARTARVRLHLRWDVSDVALPDTGNLVDGRPDAFWERLVGMDLQKPSLARSWGKAVEHALLAHEGLAASLSETQAVSLLRRCLHHLDVLAALDPGQIVRQKHSFHAVFRVFPRLCLVRIQGILPPDHPEVLAAVRTLSALQERLPEVVRAFGEAGAATEEDEPIQAAIAHLQGFYADLVEKESS